MTSMYNLTFPDICGEEIHRLVFVLAFDMIYRFAHRLRVRGDWELCDESRFLLVL